MIKKALAGGFLCLCSLVVLANEEQPIPVGAFQFSEGLATVVVDSKLGFIDSRGELVIPAIYDYATGMNKGVAMVRLNNEQILIDHTGKRIKSESTVYIPPNREDSTLVNFFEAQPDGSAKWGFKDHYGKVIIPPKYDSASAFKEGLGAFGIKDESIPITHMRHGYLDIAGNEVISATFQVAIEFSQGVSMVIDNFRHYFIDRNGKKLFDKDFAFAFDFSEGLAVVDISDNTNTLGVNTVPYNGTWGYIDLTGELIIPAIYDNAYPFHEGVAKVRIGDNWGLINTRGEQIAPPVYREIGESSEGLIPFLHAGDQMKWGFLDMQGNEVIKPAYHRVGPFSEGFAAVTIDSKRGYIDRNGNYLWEPSE